MSLKQKRPPGGAGGPQKIACVTASRSEISQAPHEIHKFCARAFAAHSSVAPGLAGPVAKIALAGPMR